MSFYAAIVGLFSCILLNIALRRFYLRFRYSRVICAWLNTLGFGFLTAFALDALFGRRQWYVELAMGVLIVLIVYSAFVRFYVAFLSEHFSERFPHRRSTLSSWKIGKSYSDFKEQIESRGFKRVGSSETTDEAYDGILAYNTYFISDDALTLLSIEFTLPESTDEITTHLISMAKFGGDNVEIFLTRNANRPIGLFAPQEYSYLNLPMQHDTFKLLDIHKARIKEAAGKLIAIDSDALEFVRKMENDWQNANIEYGILNNKRDVDELGILTSEGKYRLWIESLLLTYFGYAPKC